MCTQLNSIHIVAGIAFGRGWLPAIHSGRTKMKSTPVVLLCGAFLITSLSVRADSLFYTGAEHDSRNTEDSATVIRHSHTKLKMPSTIVVSMEPFSAITLGWANEFAHAGFSAEPPDTVIFSRATGMSFRAMDTPDADGRESDSTPAISSIGGFGSDDAFSAWRSEPSDVVGTIFPSSSGVAVPSSSFSEFGSGDPALSRFDGESARYRIGRERGKGGNGKDKGIADPASVAVPEPAALPLLLCGLAAVGILARRRSAFPTTA
jgi:hypothetical protein